MVNRSGPYGNRVHAENGIAKMGAKLLDTRDDELPPTVHIPVACFPVADPGFFTGQARCGLK